MKYALITGVSGGIGQACVDKFVAEGFSVFGSVRQLSDAQTLMDQYGDRFIPLVFDVTDFQAIQNAKTKVESIVGQHGIQCLINNAGVSIQGPMAHVSMDALRFQFEVNVMGLASVTQTFLPLLGLDERYPKGKLFNISSRAGKLANPFMGPYAASKHAVEAISDSLRRELIDFGIQVVIIEPGPIKSGIWDKVRANVNQYRNTRFEFIMDNINNGADDLERQAYPASHLAEIIYKAYAHPNPKVRYLVTRDWFTSILAIYVLPTKWVDKIILNKIKKIVLKK